MTTGNPERDKVLQRAIGECLMLHEVPVIGLVIEKLPADFDLLPEELADALAEMERVPAEPTPPDMPQPEPTPAEAQITREQAQHAMDAAHVRLDNARIAVRVAQENVRETKGALAKAITAWQTQADPLSPAERREREVRSHLASEQAKRAARRAPSSQATTFVQRQMKNGPQRGAFSMQQAARVGFRVGK